MAKDLFSGHASSYAAFRPAYPRDFYDFIFNAVDRFDCAWDVGTGNGQVAKTLSRYFIRVEATDISEKQLAQAYKAENIHYGISQAEEPPFADNSFDLITIGQAIHWFDRKRFYKEVNRVSRNEGIIAAFGYNPVRFNPEFDKHLHHFYYDVIYSYWDDDRRVVEDQYKTIEFPFEEIKTPAFRIQLQWSLNDVYGYISTWSSVQKFIRENGFNPVDKFIEEVKHLWRVEKEYVYFPLFLRLGRILK